MGQKGRRVRVDTNGVKGKKGNIKWRQPCTTEHVHREELGFTGMDEVLIYTDGINCCNITILLV
jgi:hypothetical protein